MPPVVEWGDQQRAVITALSAASASLSLLGSIYIICAYLLKWKGYNRPFNRLVFCLSLPHLINAVLWIVTAALQEVHEDVCRVAAPMKYYLLLCNFIWTCAIATDMVCPTHSLYSSAAVNRFILAKVLCFSYATTTLMGEVVPSKGAPIVW